MTFMINRTCLFCSTEYAFNYVYANILGNAYAYANANYTCVSAYSS